MVRSWWRVLTKCGPLEKRMASHFRILALKTPWIAWKGKKIGHWKMNSKGDQINHSGKNEEMEPRQKQHPVMDVTGDGSKVQCCEEQYCIGTWNVRYMKWSEVKSLSRVWLFAAPWTIAYQASLSMGFSRQEYCGGLPFPSPGDLPDPGIKPRSPTLQADSLPSKSGQP